MKKSVWRPTLISLVSCALIFVICHRWGGWPLNVLGTAVFGGLISIFAFARESVLKDEEKVFAHIQSVVEQSPPLQRLAVAMAQPLGSYHLNMPIPMLTESFSDYGLYMLHRLDTAQYQNARNQIDDWKDMVRQNRDLTQACMSPWKMTDIQLHWQRWYWPKAQRPPSMAALPNAPNAAMNLTACNTGRIQRPSP